jgi:mycothiol synthase
MMTTNDFTLGFRVREYEGQDLAPLTTIFNNIYPDEPSTLAQQEHWEQTYPANNPRMRRTAVTDAGVVVGYGECQRPFWSNQVDAYAIFIAVDPPWQRRGIGQALYTAVAPFATTQGATRLRTESRENNPGATRFLEKNGFNQIGIRFESALDMATFDEIPYAAAFDRVTANGYEILTLAEARQTDSEADLHLFDVFAATVVDVPFPGEERANPDYTNFRANTLDAPNSDPNAIFVARHKGQMVGMTNLELLPNAIAITGMTGVLAEHRGHGLAMALKLASFRYLKAHHYTEARTHNDTANPPILALNEKLGYRPLPGWLAWDKAIT